MPAIPGWIASLRGWYAFDAARVSWVDPSGVVVFEKTPDGSGWQLRVWNSTHVAAVHPTRGHVRRLLAALGVTPPTR